MKKALILAIPLLPLVALAIPSSQAPEAPGEMDQAELVEHGSYLVHRVAMCVYCHTPRDSQGALIRSREFEGAVIPVEPSEGSARWALMAPANSGFSGYTDEQAIRFLTEGIKRDGTRAQLPMPPYRLSERDARAVLAYLRSQR